MEEIRAALFDFDGTLVDNASAYADAWLELLPHITREEYTEFVRVNHLAGSTKADEMIARHFATPAILEHIQHPDWHRACAERHNSAPGIQPTLDVLVALSKAGVAIGVASSNLHENVERGLRRLGVIDYVNVVVGSDDVEGRCKPAPDVYVRAMQLLGVTADHAVAVEDSATGLAAAVSAGLRTIVIPTSATAHQCFTTAHCVLSSMPLLDEFFALLKN